MYTLNAIGLYKYKDDKTRGWRAKTSKQRTHSVTRSVGFKFKLWSNADGDAEPVLQTGSGQKKTASDVFCRTRERMSVRLLFVSAAMMCPAIACAGNLDDKSPEDVCCVSLTCTFYSLGFTERAVRRSQWALSHINSTKFDRIGFRVRSQRAENA